MSGFPLLASRTNLTVIKLPVSYDFDSVHKVDKTAYSSVSCVETGGGSCAVSLIVSLLDSTSFCSVEVFGDETFCADNFLISFFSVSISRRALFELLNATNAATGTAMASKTIKNPNISIYLCVSVTKFYINIIVDK